MIDEDYVGICKNIVQASVSATAPHRVPLAFSEKLSWGLHFLNVYGDEYKAT